MVKIMNKKKVSYLVVVVFIIVVFISISMSGPKENKTIEVGTDYDSSYYVDASNNLFVKFANVCDDCCYYVVDMLFGGVETIFSSFIGN